MPGPAIVRVAAADDTCALWRFRVPLSVVTSSQQSLYSPTFEVGGASWRLHTQQRVDPQTQQPFLAAHLQFVSRDAETAFSHFRLTLCNADPTRAREKMLHCHFRRFTQAYGIHHFVERAAIVDPNEGFIDYSDAATGPCLLLDALVKVVPAAADGTYTFSRLPQSLGPPPVLSGPPAKLATPSQASAPSAPSRPRPSADLHGSGTGAALQYPYDDALCDMTFVVPGDIGCKAHRCVVAARAPRLIPPAQNPLPVDAVVAVDVPLVVLRSFLKFLYTEQGPGQDSLDAEGMLCLYALALDQGHHALAAHCLQRASSLLTHHNILTVVIDGGHAADDEYLNTLFLDVLAGSYDHIIDDVDFERLPGHLSRRLCRIVARHERLPPLQLPSDSTSLSADLGKLAQSGAYADHTLVLGDGTALPAHRVVLSSRSVVYNNAFYRQIGELPDVGGPTMAFTAPAWRRFLHALYRNAAPPVSEMTEEEVVLTWKATEAFGLDGRLRRQSEAAVTQSAALRLLLFAEKHDEGSMREAALLLLSSRFADRMRHDSNAWSVIEDLPQPALLRLFKTVVSEGVV